MPNVIDGIKKVSLAVLLEQPAAQTKELEKAASLLEMIYGIGTQGLSAFELSLAGKQSGDVMRLKVSSFQAEEFFGPFLTPVRQQLGLSILPTEMDFLIEIKEVKDAENHEVVKALANSGGHGCGGGSCDCGCC